MLNPGLYSQHLETCIVVATADCESALELGCGTADKLAVCQCSHREGVDAHGPYLELARKRWGPRLQTLHEGEATKFVAEAVARGCTWDAVLLIDFIEHLEKEVGLVLLSQCKQIAGCRVIMYCPEGECPQDQDVYNLGGEHWQTHRASWSFEDLQEAGFAVARWENHHGPGKHALFAVQGVL